jgi:hypothetical protein
MIFGRARHEADCPDLGPECNGSTKPTPIIHDVALFATDMALDATYGLTRWLALEARAPLRVVKTTPHFFTLNGQPLDRPNDIHHHDETLWGPGDPWLIARFAAARGSFVWVSRVGVTLPLGRTEEDPYRLGALGLSHEHIQLGTGTFVPIVGGGLAWLGRPIELSASTLGFFSAYAGSNGYQAPLRLYVTARAALPLLDATLRPYLGSYFSHEGKEKWHGDFGAEGTTPVNDLLLGGGLEWTFARPWSVDAGVRFRAVRFTDAATFDYPAVLVFGISTQIDVAERVVGPNALP